MAATKTTITGPVYLPNCSKPNEGKIVFELSSWDRQAGEALFVSGPFVATLDENGDFSVDIFTVSAGENQVVYRVYSTYIDQEGNYKKEFIGTIGLVGPGPFSMSDLDFITEWTSNSFDVLAQIEATRLTVINSSDAATASAQAASTSAQDAQNAKTAAELVRDDVLLAIPHIQVMNMADFEAFNVVTSATVINLKGYHANTDLGGGVYDLSVGTADGGLIVEDGLGRKWKRRMGNMPIMAASVYGAKIDGVTDDSVAVKAAMAWLLTQGGGELHFEYTGDECVVSGAPFYFEKNIALVGIGGQVTIMNTLGGSQAFRGRTDTKVQWRNIQLSGGGGNWSYIYYTGNNSIFDLNVGDKWAITHEHRVFLTDDEAKVEADTIAAFVNAGSGFHPSTNAATGIEFRDGCTGILKGGLIRNVKTCLKVGRNANNLDIEKNTIIHYSTRGIEIRGTSSTVFPSWIGVQDNYVFAAMAGATSRYAIYSYFVGTGRPKHIKIKNNKLRLPHLPYIADTPSVNNANGDAITVHGCRHVEVSGNDIDGSGEVGITVSQGTRHFTVFGNLITGSETAAISIGGAGDINQHGSCTGNKAFNWSLDRNNDHGPQSAFTYSNVDHFVAGNNTGVIDNSVAGVIGDANFLVKTSADVTNFKPVGGDGISDINNSAKLYNYGHNGFRNIVMILSVTSSGVATQLTEMGGTVTKTSAGRYNVVWDEPPISVNGVCTDQSRRFAYDGFIGASNFQTKHRTLTVTDTDSDAGFIITAHA